ncbi:hypothetical protein ACEWY4_009699 [Coilia grayii]|uniref:Transcobalamin-like C-terminal domain-containing protein n=1 Tax=Coilia grayii TaxID=363190 RepID=A0ABD1K756_9TELE
MALRLFTALCLMAPMLLLGPQITAEQLQEIQFQLGVKNEIYNSPFVVYDATCKPGGVLLGAMRRLHQTNNDFKFTVTENNDYGYYLESVNGLAGNNAEHTYWQILSHVDGTFTPTPVGVGCYIPKANEVIVFNFTTW